MFFRETNNHACCLCRKVYSVESYKRPICNPVSDVAYFDDLTIVSFDTCVVLLEEGLCGIWQNVVGCTTIAVIAFHGV